MTDGEEGWRETVPEAATDVDEATIESAAKHVRRSDRLVAFTGAGASTESGIPDFRSPGGLWDRYDPSDFTIQALRRDPVAYWERRLEVADGQEFDWDAMEPNPAHEALADLERSGPLSAVITQNVDGLHQAVGNDPGSVLELHGTRDGARCLGCGERRPLDELERQLEGRSLPPRCGDCDGLLKRATVAFGEQLPRDVLESAKAEARAADCLLVVGSSLTVEPAASLPRIAARNGADLVIVNIGETPMDDAAAVVVRGEAGRVLPRIVERSI